MNGDFNIQPARFDFSQGGPLGGLQGLMGGQRQPQQQPDYFASQTPGAPQQPGRIDASSFGGGQGAQGEQGGGMDVIAMLMHNIAKSFGGS